MWAGTDPLLSSSLAGPVVALCHPVVTSQLSSHQSSFASLPHLLPADTEQDGWHRQGLSWGDFMLLISPFCSAQK